MEIMTKTSDTLSLVKDSLTKGTSYGDYRKLVEDHVEKGTSTGPNQTESLTQYTLLNHSRMKRLDKTVKIPEDIQKKFENFSGKQTWLVLTESWCGDAAQSMPAMNKLADFSPNIDFKVLLRDKHLDLMNAFLTNGAMSIPKLIVWDHEKEEVVADWGPRPSIATQMVADFKEAHGTLTPEFKKDLQVWYNKDKSQNIIEDLSQMI